MKNNKTLYMIGNAHIDPVWLWQWQEGFHEVKATFRSALDRLKEFPDFVFVSSSAAFYEWVEKSDPAMFAEIRARIAEGRWRVVGGWWIQPDCNIPGGESFVRQALYGQRYFQEKFGLMATTGYNVDSFGHHGNLPQLLCKAGLRHYVFLRPQPHEKGLPNRLFWWESNDGSRVLAYRLPYEYCTWGQDLAKHVERCADELKSPFDAGMCFYGVGNHGGGPTRENLESIKRLNEDDALPNLVCSDPDTFFNEMLQQNLPIPVVHDELQNHAIGCYAAHSGIKQWNRLAENRLFAAEKFASLAARVLDQPYPAQEFKQAWKNVLFNQFHDILAGTSLESAYEDARHMYGEAISIADRAQNYALQALAWNIDIPYAADTKPLVVFNPHAWQNQSVVEFQVRDLSQPFTLLDDENRVVPVQMIQSEAAANGQYRLSFATDLPPLGYRTYHLVPAAAPLPAIPALTASDTTLENSRFRLEFDPMTGCITRLFDKQQQVEVFQGPAARPVVLDDPSDTWSHNFFRYQNEIGSFTAASVRLIACGPVQAVIRVTSTYGASRLIQDFTMYQDRDQIDVHVTVDWREQQKALKLRFPVNLNHMRTIYEIPYGIIERDNNGDEEPGQSWLDLSGTNRSTGTTYGLSLLNDGKYSFDVTMRDIGLTVLRSPIYAHHVPAQPAPDQSYHYIDQGIQHFTYTLLPHAGSWESAGTVRRAAELNQKPIVLLSTFHAGPLPQHQAFLTAEPENIMVSVLKQAEGAGDWIIRGYETGQEATEAVITVGNQVIKAQFKPCEIKTFCLPQDETRPVYETTLLEELR